MKNYFFSGYVCCVLLLVVELIRCPTIIRCDLNITFLFKEYCEVIIRCSSKACVDGGESEEQNSRAQKKKADVSNSRRCGWVNSGHRVWRIIGGASVNRCTSRPTSGGGCGRGCCLLDSCWCFCDCCWCWSLSHFACCGCRWWEWAGGFLISCRHRRFDYYMRFSSWHLRSSCGFSCRRWCRCGGRLLVDYKLCNVVTKDTTNSF